MMTTLFATALALTMFAADGRVPTVSTVGADDVSIVVWMDGRDVYRRGDRPRVYFRSATDGYVTIFRVDTDGRVRVLYPHLPWDENYVQAGRRYEVRSPSTHAGSRAFVVDDYPGQGYLFAVVSLAPFHYGAFVTNGRWDYRLVGYGGRIAGDPYVALSDLVDRIVPLGYDGYGYDVTVYHVERHYEYPRFLCYDCHRHLAYPAWDPYRDWCATFRIVIYDPHPVRVYPYAVNVYPPTAVVYRRPVRLAPRFVFERQAGGQPYVTRTRRPPAASVRGTDGRRGDAIPVRQREPARPVPAASDDRRSPTGRVGTEGAEPRPRVRTPAAESPRRDARPTLERRAPREIDRPPVRKPVAAPAPTPRAEPDPAPKAGPARSQGEPPAAAPTGPARKANPARPAPKRRPAPRAGTRSTPRRPPEGRPST